MGPRRPGRIALCPRCQRDTLPQLKQPSWHREKHRATKAERDEPSPAAQAIERRKEAKRLRRITRADGFLAMARTVLYLNGDKAPLPQSIDEDCSRCRKLQGAA